MFFSMKLTIQQIYDVKFILSGKSKSEVAKFLGVANSNQFSNLDRYKGLCDKLDEYFNRFNPEINQSVIKITDVEIQNKNEAGEPLAQYSKLTSDLLLIEKDKRINELAECVGTYKKMADYLDKRWQDDQETIDSLKLEVHELKTGKPYKKQTGSD